MPNSVWYNIVVYTTNCADCDQNRSKNRLKKICLTDGQD